VSDLETRLAALSEEIAWPPTPDLSGPVMARVAAEPRRRPLAPGGTPRPFRLAPVAAAVAAALLALAIALAASPAVRARLAAWLGVGSVRIQRVERLPDIGPAANLGLGERTSLAAARRRTGLDVPVVRALGAPDAVYVQRGGGGAVSLVYVARSGLPPSTNGIGALLSILPAGGLAPVQKLVDGGVPITRVRIRGAHGYFIGGEHVFAPPQRLAGRTLLWARGGVTYRLEGALPLDTAVRRARSVR